MSQKGFINRASSLIIARVLKDCLSFLLMLWLARTDQAGFGLLSFAVGLSFLVLALLDLGLDQYLLREFSRVQSSPTELLNTLLRMRVILGLVLLGAMAAFLALRGYAPSSLVLVLGVCLARVFESCAETLLNVFRARARQVLEAQLSTAALVIGAGYGTLLLLLDRGPGPWSSSWWSTPG